MKRIFVLTALICITFLNLTAEQLFMVVTPEKTGTHLLTKALTRMTHKKVINNWGHTISIAELNRELDYAEANNSYLHMHANPTLEIISTLQKRNYKVIFLMRDPRDVVVSLMYYIEKGWSYSAYDLNKEYGKLSMDQKLLALISGKNMGVSAVVSIIGHKMLWMEYDKSFVKTTRFERLVGAKGGGSDKAQRKEIAKLAKFLEIPMSEEEITTVTTDLFGKPNEGTFRKGEIGSWKTHFTKEHVQAFKVAFGKELIKLKYEKDKKWTN